MRTTRWIALLTAMMMVLAACADSADDGTTTTSAGSTDTTEGTTDTTEGSTDTTAGEGGDEDPIVFASSLPLTGEFSVTGTKHRDGYQFCVDEINARGGLLGRPVELLVEDNRSDTEVTVTQMERFINVENVDVLLGTFSSLLGFPASTVAEQNGMIYPMPSSAALRVWERGYEHIFYFQALAGEYTGQAVLNMLEHYTSEGVVATPPQTAAVVYADDFFAGAIANGLVGGSVQIPDSDRVVDLAPGFLADAGIELVYEEVWPIGYTDWITLANSIRTADADMLIISSASVDEVIALVQALQTVGYQPDMVYTAQGTQTEFRDSLDGAAEGIVVHSVWSPLANFSGVLGGEEYSNEDFVNNYTAARGTAPDEDEAIPFAVCQGVEQAIAATGTTDNLVLSEWLHSRTADDPVRTILGDFVWDERGLPEGKSFLVNQWQGGEIEFIFPVGEFPGTVDLVYPKPEW
ncbi:MAG: amino acid ABC transporter substrate-binding protein [Acidimicrobiia bacterium]